jgi:hypothetical protein
METIIKIESGAVWSVATIMVAVRGQRSSVAGWIFQYLYAPFGLVRFFNGRPSVIETSSTTVRRSGRIRGKAVSRLSEVS